MASYPPPNENVAIFNPLNFISGGEGLTLAEGKKFFLQFPDAQGEENLETTNVDGVLTANDQAFFNDKITLEQTASGEDALNILVDSPGYAIRATTRTSPTTNSQITIAPTATDNQINTIVQLGDALIYSTTGNLTGGSLAITALGAVADFGVRLNATDDIVEVGGLLELMTNDGIKFNDNTIQTTAYTGSVSPNLSFINQLLAPVSVPIGTGIASVSFTNTLNIPSAGNWLIIGNFNVNFAITPPNPSTTTQGYFISGFGGLNFTDFGDLVGNAIPLGLSLLKQFSSTTAAINTDIYTLELDCQWPQHPISKPGGQTADYHPSPRQHFGYINKLFPEIEWSDTTRKFVAEQESIVMKARTFDDLPFRPVIPARL
jgi:hypothetical protein